MSAATSYDVRVWKIGTYKGVRATTYRVRWAVGGRPCGQSFSTRKLAESFRASLITASRQGEAFDVESGLPISQRVRQAEQTWFDLALAFADLKWDESS